MRNKIILGDCLEELKKLPDNSIDCCVTSPPYYALRSYMENEPREVGKEERLWEYIDKMVEIFGEVYRVLKPTGTCWINIGDSYSGSGKGRNPCGSTHKSSFFGKQKTNKSVWGNIKSGIKPEGIKRKELMNVPHRLVFALSDAGWYHRQTIIWAKATSGEIREGTCMPESVNDRLNQSFEYIFLLTKKDKYYFDSYAIKEPLSSSTNKESTGMANMRSVWRINLQQGSSGQHIAGYPEKIPYYCIKAGSSEKGCCKDCGKPYERILEKLGKINHSWAPGTRDYHKLEKSKGRHGSTSAFLTDESVNYVHSGWKKTCNCESDEISPSLILDPFMGSGTTAVVALKEDRDLLGIELNPEYKEFAENRIKPYFFKSKDLF